MGETIVQYFQSCKNKQIKLNEAIRTPYWQQDPIPGPIDAGSPNPSLNKFKHIKYFKAVCKHNINLACNIASTTAAITSAVFKGRAVFVSIHFALSLAFFSLKRSSNNLE